MKNEFEMLKTYPIADTGLIGTILAELSTEEGKLRLLVAGEEMPLKDGESAKFQIESGEQAYAALMAMLNFLAPTLCTIAIHDGVDRINKALERSGYGLAFNVSDADLLGGLDIRGLRASVVSNGTGDVSDSSGRVEDGETQD